MDEIGSQYGSVRAYVQGNCFNIHALSLHQKDLPSLAGLRTRSRIDFYLHYFCVKLSSRYGLPILGALAALSLVHWSRAHQTLDSQVLLYLRGVLPNLLAQVAVTFVILAIWADQQERFEFLPAKRWCIISTSISTVGLVGWEFIQQGSRHLVFDPHDIGAIFVGAGISLGIFYWITPRTA